MLNPTLNNEVLEGIMGKIILLDNLKPTSEELAHDQWLMEQYNSDPVLRQKADALHHSRLMSGPACHQCIEVALKRMEKEKCQKAT